MNYLNEQANLCQGGAIGYVRVTRLGNNRANIDVELSMPLPISLSKPSQMQRWAPHNSLPETTRDIDDDG